MKAFPALIAALAMAVATVAVAHDHAAPAGTKALHGGQLRAAGANYYELVVAAPGTSAPSLPVTIYVTDHAGAKVPSQGATGTVTLLSGGQKSTIALQSAGDNVLKGSGDYVPQHGLKAVVSVTLRGQDAAQARFEPFAAHSH